MSEAPVGRLTGRAVNFYMLWFGMLCVAVAIAVIATWRTPTAIGVLLSPCFVGAVSWKFKRAIPKRAPQGSRPGGILIAAVVVAMPGAILIFVGNLVGGAFFECFCTAVGATFLGLGGLFFTLAWSFPRA
jgi:hypothetical protein